jgi:hypothetical protein
MFPQMFIPLKAKQGSCVIHTGFLAALFLNLKMDASIATGYSQLGRKISGCKIL